MKMIASALVALAIAASAAAPASAQDCSKALSKGGAKAFFTCLERDKN